MPKFLHTTVTTVALLGVFFLKALLSVFPNAMKNKILYYTFTLMQKSSNLDLEILKMWILDSRSGFEDLCYKACSIYGEIMSNTLCMHRGERYTIQILGIHSQNTEMK